MEELKSFPAIICRKNTEFRGVTSPDQFCMFANIQKILLCEKDVAVVFKPITPVQQIKLCDQRNDVFFGLDMDKAITDLNSSAWSVRKVNVFEILQEVGISV